MPEIKIRSAMIVLSGLVGLLVTLYLTLTGDGDLALLAGLVTVSFTVILMAINRIINRLTGD